MSIIYEALKKVEGQKEILVPESTSQSITPSVERKEKKVVKERKHLFLPIVLFLIVLGLAALLFILPRQKHDQEQVAVVPAVAENKEVDPARVYRNFEPKNQASEEVIIRKEPVQEYILEGIVYDPKASFALINGKVINEADNIGDFRIDKISVDKVEMINIQDNNKVILSLP